LQKKSEEGLAPFGQEQHGRLYKMDRREAEQEIDLRSFVLGHAMRALVTQETLAPAQLVAVMDNFAEAYAAYARETTAHVAPGDFIRDLARRAAFLAPEAKREMEAMVERCPRLQRPGPLSLFSPLAYRAD
jgi:hypothetical protein